MDLSRLQKAAAIAASRNAMSDWESLPVADGAVYQPVVDLSPPAAAQEQQEESGAVTRNFKKSFAQVPQAIGGTIAAVGDVIGADGMRDYGLELYKSASKNVESLTRDSDSFSSMIEGKTGFGDWIAGASGYVVGQALQMIATGGAGAALGKLGAQKAAQWAAKELGETAAKRAAVAGAAGAVGLANAGQEVGSVYPEMLDEVRKQGREPDAADKARAIMFALGAAGLDTAVDMTLAGRALRGAAGGGIRGLAGEVVKSAGKETGTEAVQTVMERAGAQQSLGDADAVRDVIDSAAIGAVGGGGAGAIAGLHGGRGTQTLPPVNQGAPDAGAPPPDAGPAQPGPDGQQPPALPPPGVPNPDTQAPAGPSGPGPAQPPGGPDAGATPDAGPAQPDAPAQAMAAPAPDAGPAPVAPASAPGEPGAQEVAQGGPVGPASSMGGGPVGPTPAQGGGPVGPAGPGGGPVTPMAPPAGPLTAALQSAPQAVAHAQGLQRAQAAALEQQRIAAQPAPAPQDPFAADVQALHALLQDQDALDRVAAVSGEQGVQAILKSAADAANPRLPAPARLRAINIVRRRLAGQEPINAPTRTSSPLQRPAEPGVGGVATGPDLGAGVQVPAGMGPAPAEPLAPGLHRADGPGAVDPAGLAARGPQPAADAVAPAVYPSIGEATDYIRAARRRGSNVAAKVVPVRGGFQIITPADPGFAEAMDARQNGPVIESTAREIPSGQAGRTQPAPGRADVAPAPSADPATPLRDSIQRPADPQGRPLRADVLESRSETPAGWGSVSNEPESAPVDPKLAEDRKAQVRRELADAGLGAEVEALERSGKLVIEHNPASSSRGSFDGRTATLNAARLEDGQALGVLLHEVGAHMGLRRLIGDELYDMLPGRIRALAAQGMREAVAAVRAAEQDTAARQASGRRSTTAIENEEVIAYFVQAMTESRQMRGRGLIHQIVTAVRAALRRLGFNLQVSPRDVAGMAMAAVKAEARSANAASKGGVAEEGAGVRASATKERVTPGLVQTERPDETGSEARASSARPNEVTRESKTGTTSGTSVADSTLESRSPRHSGDVLEARLGSLLTQGAGAITDRLTRWMTDGMENRPAWEGKILPRAGQRVLNGLKTQYHKAQREPLYRPVFEAMRAFSTDTARIANQAASLAPDLLVDLDQFKDALPALLGGRKGASKADLAKVSKAIFDGTLVKPDDVMAGKTWTDAELASQFGMNAYQIELYRQARAAIDQSLDDFGRAQLGVLTRGEVAKAVTAQAQAAPKMADAARVLAADLRQQAAGFAQQGKTAEAQKATDLADKVGAMAAHVAKLKDAGYAPLYRFGTFAVSAFDPSGKTLYYATFDNLREANAHRRAIEPTIQAQHPNAVIRSGHVNPEEGKLFRQVSLSTLEVFGDVAFSGDPAWKTYIELTKNSRSSLKRLLERQGTAGFSTDIQRGLSSFITSNARYASGALHLHDATQAAAAIPTERGDVKREAQRLIEYVQDPREEMAGFRGLMFTWYLGGSVAAAAVNMTQSLTMTYPWLAQHESIAQASARVLAAMSAVARGVYGDPTMAAAVRRADANGITSPQQIYYLQAEQSRTFGNSMAVRKFMHAWGYMFGKAEQYNRRVAFVAAYRQAQQRGIADPYAYAAKAVDETQGVYCVDTETEMLTADGWKRYNQIRVGERAFGVDADGNLVETEINGVHVFHGKHVAEHIHGPEGTSIVVTAEHRNFIQCYNSRDKKHQRPRMVLTKDLKGCHLIPRAPLGDATERVAVYTDDQVRLIAWVAAEGHFFAHRNCKVKRAVGIVQSLTHNPHYVEEIDALLNRLGGHFNRKVSKKRARGDVMVTWQLRKPLWEFIGRALPQKRVSMDLLSKLTVPQMRVFIEEFAKGDGTGNGSETAGLGIGQKSIETLDTLQAMAALTGSASTCWHRQKNTLTGGVRDHGTVYIHRGNKRAQVGAMKRESIVVDTVWCPETGSGTWIARRNGRTFVTGNSRESRPNYGRGSIGAAALTFKQYSIGYLEFLARMIRHDPNRSAEENAQAKRAAALAMGVLFLFAGTSGLPFMTDAEDLIDTIMQALGFNWRTAARRKQFVASVFGDAFAGFAERGISPALPMDIQSRLGMGNLIPGTDALRQDKDPRAREKSEVFGVAGGLAEKAQDAAEEAVRGNLSRAAAMAAPKAITDLLVGLDMAMTGRYRDTRGRNVIDVGLGDAITKGIGFQPEDVSAVQRAAREANATAAMHRGVKDEITQRWAAGIAANDPDEIEAARAQLRAYNQSNPDMRITVAPASLRSRVRQINLTKAERVRRALPKDIRAVVAQSS